MNTDHYRLSNSQFAAEKLRSILERSGGSTRNLQMRIAFAETLFVKFGVHEPSRTVFISNFRISKRHV